MLSGVGVAAIVLGSGAIAVGVTSPAQAAAKSLKYSCSATVFETTLDQGVWTASVDVALPSQVNVGASIPAPSITAKVTTSTTAADTLRSLNVKSVRGTSAADYTVGTAARTADLTVPTTTVPASGAIVTNAAGKGASETAPSTPGTVPVKVGNFTATLTTDGGTVIPTKCTLQSGQDATIGSIKVVDPAATSTTSTTATSTTSTTSTSSTSTSTTTSPSPTSTSTTPPPSTSTTSTTPPPTSTTSRSTPTTAVVPNVVGLRLDRAVAKLSDFTVWATVEGSTAPQGNHPGQFAGGSQASSPSAPTLDLTKYVVTSQKPAGGTTAAIGSDVVLTVRALADGPSPTDTASSSPGSTGTFPVIPTTVQTGSTGGSSDLGPLVAVGAGMTGLGVLALGGGLLSARRRDEA